MLLYVFQYYLNIIFYNKNNKNKELNKFKLYYEIVLFKV